MDWVILFKIHSSTTDNTSQPDGQISVYSRYEVSELKIKDAEKLRYWNVVIIERPRKYEYS